MAVPQKTLRAKPTSCCTQFEARTWTRAPHPLLAPSLQTGSSRAWVKSNTLKQSVQVLQRFSQLPEAFYWGEARNRTPDSSSSDVKQGRTCAALRDSQLSHLPGSEQLFLASHPHTPLNTWQIATVCPLFITAFDSGCRALSGSPGAWGSVGILRGLCMLNSC